MSRLNQRLRKLEQAYPRDSSGLLVNSPEWMAYWLAKIQRIFDGIEEQGPEQLPFAAIRAWMQSVPDDGE